MVKTSYKNEDSRYIREDIAVFLHYMNGCLIWSDRQKCQDSEDYR